MRVQQLRSVLEHVTESRLEMHKLYLRLYHFADGTRVKLLLNYLQSEELAKSQAIAAYIDTSAKRTLDTWFENVRFESIHIACDKVYLPADMTTDQVMDLHLTLDAEVMSVLDKILNLAINNDVRSALSSIVSTAKVKRQRLMHNLTRMEDM
ncbi:hypothetical protein [Shewanella sp. NIFS-20-20]|uniref:hypothetical protein n=1 Tax=Shewanella sp. NIFS-20-20 TaxID=2853806 RepID=UPI001C44D47F|nr:hypothetical protein [Shewanella sp. NIFS-20-20]MBV7316744.1 hypothetical protein [Shewanella sp. NIFS-20-20]